MQADARALPFPDAAFDTALCTFSLCAIPDEPGAIAEMHRVLRPGGLLLLADHITSSNIAVRQLQRAAHPIGAVSGIGRVAGVLELATAASREVAARRDYMLGARDQAAVGVDAVTRKSEGDMPSA